MNSKLVINLKVLTESKKSQQTKAIKVGFINLKYLTFKVDI